MRVKESGVLCTFVDVNQCGRCNAATDPEQSYHLIQPFHFWAYKKELRQRLQGGICTAMFRTAVFTKAKTWMQSKCPLME